MENQNFPNNLQHLLSTDASEGEMKGVLTYGSLIYLCYNEESNTTSIEYYAYSEGLTETKVLLKTKNSLQSEGSYTRGVFRIYPAFYHDAYLKGKNKFEEISEFGIINQLDKRGKRAHIPKLVKGINEELALNLDIYEKLKGTPVRYGSIIQLLHVASQKYLSYDPENPSDLESDCLKIQLKYENSEYTCFRVMPSFKYQQESQGYIFNEDVLYLMSTVDSAAKTIGDPYLHASRTIGVLNEEVPTMEHIEKKEINVSNDKKTMWKIKIFSDFVDEKLGILSIGDIIWINLSEEDKNLVIQDYGDKENQYNCRFISCSSSEKYKRFVGNSNGMFIIESKSMSEGGLVEWSTFYRLKHLSTNKYLAVGPQVVWNFVEKKDLKAQGFKLVDTENEATNFSFEMLYSTISSKNKQLLLKFIPKDAYFRLKTDKGLYLTYRDVSRDDLETKGLDDGDYVTVPLAASVNENNIFYCSRANQVEVLMTRFLISSKQTIQDSLKCLRPDFLNAEEMGFQQITVSHKLASSKIERAKECLSKLELFCRNKLLDYLSVDDIYGHVNNFIQDVLKEQSFIELLVQMLVLSFPSYQDLENLQHSEIRRKDRKNHKLKMQLTNAFNAPDASNGDITLARAESMVSYASADDNPYIAEMMDDVNHRKKKMCQLIYQLITAICEENLGNKNYLSRYLPLFQMQAEFIPNAIICVNMILQENEELLLNLHQLSNFNQSQGATLNKLTTQLDKSPSKRRTVAKRFGTGSGTMIISGKFQEHIQLGDDVYMGAYQRYYNRIISLLNTDVSKMLYDWNAIQFFATLLQRTQDVNKQKMLLSFFKIINLYEGRGININQETTFKYFTNYSDKYESLMTSHLLKLFVNEQHDLCVTAPLNRYKGKTFEIREFIEDLGIDQSPQFTQLMDEDDEESDDENPVDNFRSTGNINEELLISHIDLWDALCRSRNFSWKKRLEREISWEALLNQLKHELPDEVKASINRLLTSLYIDQEPRREATVPLFCKIAFTDKTEVYETDEKNQEESKQLITAQNNSSLISLKNHNNFLADRGAEDVHLEQFRAQILTQVEQLDFYMTQLPLELTKENMIVFDKKIQDYWHKIYNSYILEVLQTVHLMLKFKKIKIKTKPLEMDPLPKKSDNMLNKLNIMNHLDLNLDLFKKGNKIDAGEFGNIMKSLICLLEYDKTYPEAKKMLIEQREERKDVSNVGSVVKNLFSASKLFGRLKGIAHFAKDLMFKKQEEERSKKRKMDLGFLDKELTSNQVYLKQADIMKNILEDLLGEQEIEIETTIKMKIMDILNYFFDYKQDKLFSNTRKVFLKMVEETELLKLYRENYGNLDQIKETIHDALSHYLQYILPRVMLTGTDIDKNEDVREDREDILDINEILDFEILPVLLQQLSLNNNKVFEKKVLHLMLRIYNQREDFANAAKNMLLLFDEKDTQNFVEAKKYYKLLQRYTEESENWLSASKVDTDKLMETRRILIFFYNSLFSNNPVIIQEVRDFDPFRLERDPIDKTRQDVYRHLRIYLPVLSLIKDNIHILESTQDKAVQELFKLCFSFLTAFVKDNHENQLVLSNSMIVFQYNMQTNLGQVKLIIEIFRDNLALCTTKLEEVLGSFVKLIFSSGRKAEYLEFFKVIQKVQGKLLYDNQRLVLDTFLEPVHKKTLLYLASELDIQEIDRNDPKDYRNQYINIFGFEKLIYSRITKAGDEPFYYHAELLECLSMTAIGKEGLILNEIRLRSAVEFGYLVELLCEEDKFTSANEGDKRINEFEPENFELLKIPIVNYLFYVYLESEKVAEETARNKEGMQKLIEKEQQRLIDIRYYKDSYLVYLFEHLLLVFHWYYKQGIITNDREENPYRNDYQILLQFVKTLKSNIKKFDPKKVSETGKKNLRNLLVFLDESKGLDSFFAENQNSENLENYHEDDRATKAHELDEALIYECLWDQFLDVFTNSKMLTDAIDKEKKIFAKALMNVDNMTKKHNVMKNIMNNEEVTKKLINFIIDNDYNEETSETILLILDALGNIIENEKDEDRKTEKQNFLNRNNSVYMIFSKLSNPENGFQEKLSQKFIEFAIKLLEGGNVEVQKNIYLHFTNFTNSEVFFIKIHERFLAEIQKLKKLDDEPQIAINEEDNDQMKDILRLLQLFAEGHFSDLQNYIRHQTNSHHSYDLLADISDLLNVFMVVKHTAFFDTMIQCFDTLIEFIQGPCFYNQLAVVQSSFLDLASNLLSVDERAEEISIAVGRKEPNPSALKKWQLARLKHKCSLALLSLLEARKDNTNVHRMMKSLPLEIFHKNIADIYRLFKQEYKGNYDENVFVHFNHAPEDGYSEDHCSLIVETGFNLYFLMSIFQEVQLPGEALDEANEDDEKPEGNKMLGDNIVTKWGEVMFSIVKTGFKTAQSIASGALEKAQELKDQMLKKQDDEDDKENKQEHMILLQLAQEREESLNEALNFFKKNTAHIEVLREDNHLEKTYFTIPPFCSAITKDTKIKFNSSVDRISAKTKCDYLLKTSDDYIEIIKFEYKLQKLFNRIKLLSILTSNISLWKDTAFILAIVLNILVLISFKRDDEATLGFSSDLDSEIRSVGSILIVLSLFIVAYFLINTAPLIIKKAFKGASEDKFKIFTYTVRLFNTTTALFSDFQVLYYILYGVSAVIGVAITPLFFSLHLLDVLARYPTLQNVLKSIYQPRKQLLLTYLLFQIFNYFFSLFGYYFIRDDYHGYCPNTWICFLTAFDKAFKADGGLGGFMGVDDEMNILRFFFDNLYNLIMMIIVINIVSGLIIDTFGSLRDEEQEFQYDITNICFICGFDRETLDKAAEVKHGRSGFEQHIEKDHYLWNYLFYIAYIKEKDKTEHTGLESYIAEQLENEEISWFPTHKALILKGYSDEADEHNALETLKRIEGKQVDLTKTTGDMTKSISSLEYLVKKNQEKKKKTKKPAEAKLNLKDKPVEEVAEAKGGASPTKQKEQQPARDMSPTKPRERNVEGSMTLLEGADEDSYDFKLSDTLMKL